MSIFSNLSDADLENQIRALSKELDQLKRLVSRRGAEIADTAGATAGDVYASLAEQLAASLPKLRRSAKSIEKTAYDHPATVATVGLIVVGLMATILLRRR